MRSETGLRGFPSPAIDPMRVRGFWCSDLMVFLEVISQPAGRIIMRKAVLICAALVTVIFVIVMLVADADARGRTGSYRVGGYNSHGKGSHYVGGH
jgi:hypothetical protein